MRVKICGITNLEDAFNAIEAGADALGFVFYRDSPRYITPIEAQKIVAALPPFVGRVGLFVDEDAQTIDKICKETKMSLAQIHFDVDEAFLDSLETQSIPVVRAKSAKDIARFSECYRLVDAYSEAYGGSGKRVNLEWFDGVDCSKIILAGGLDSHNVASTLAYNFYGVDVSSGTESQKGKKDPQKVRDFINNAKTI